MKEGYKVLRGALVRMTFRSLFDPDQPREPAGSPDGGQFASGGGGKSSGKPQQDIRDVKDAVERDVKDYLGKQYSSINRALRSGRISDQVKSIDRAIAELDGNDANEVYRGLSGPKVPKLLRMLKDGGEFTDKGFFSTSRNPTTAKAFAGGFGEGVVFKIKGVRGIGLHVDKYFNSGSGEAEVLLPRGSRFRVEKIESSSMANEGIAQVVLRRIA